MDGGDGERQRLRDTTAGVRQRQTERAGGVILLGRGLEEGPPLISVEIFAPAVNLSALARRPCPICGCREQPDSVDDRRYAANYHYAWDGQGFIFVGESEG